jgi:hypothetical protein
LVQLTSGVPWSWIAGCGLAGAVAVSGGWRRSISFAMTRLIQVLTVMPSWLAKRFTAAIISLRESHRHHLTQDGALPPAGRAGRGQVPWVLVEVLGHAALRGVFHGQIIGRAGTGVQVGMVLGSGRTAWPCPALTLHCWRSASRRMLW